MKKSILLKACCLLTIPCALAEVPTGSLTLNKNIVREGATPRISWEINHPVSIVDEIVDVDEGEITTKKKVRVDVYMIGTAVWNHKTVTKTMVSFNESGWEDVYTGRGVGLDSGVIRASRTLEVGQSVQVAAKAEHSIFSHVDWVNNDSKNCMVLKSGDTPASTNGWGGDASMEDYLQPYLSDGKLNIGPRDLMIAFELTHDQSQTDESGYDSNDSIVLLRFTEVE